jgi:hypothetical protein
MEVALQREAHNLKLDIFRLLGLHGVMEKMKNMEPYYFY